MEIIMIGLGKMGLGIAENLIKHNYYVKGTDISAVQGEKLEMLGGKFFENIESAICSETKGKKIFWTMLPAGEITNSVVNQLSNLLNSGDIIIDAGNSHYKDSVMNYTKCISKGINFLDVGTSGGVFGAKEGACMMIGGDHHIYKSIEKIFEDICVKDGFLFCGFPGSGHYLKMVHNGIEYGMMQSISEGFNLLYHSNYNFNLSEVARVFNNGSVIRSWLMELTEKVYQTNLDFSEIVGVIPSSGEGKWTVEEALELKINMPVITQSLMTRYSSEDQEKMGEKLIALLRHQFGGHDYLKDE